MIDLAAALARANDIMQQIDDKEALTTSFGFPNKRAFADWVQDIQDVVMAPALLEYIEWPNCSPEQAYILALCDVVLCTLVVGREAARAD